MTTNRKAQLVKIHVTSHHARVRFGSLATFDGFPALLIIAIILTSKSVYAITRLALVLLCWISPLAFRFALRQIAGLYLCFRAFYTE